MIKGTGLSSLRDLFKIRNSRGTELFPPSTMNDLYEMVKKQKKL
jgi:hypothetical protein